MEITLTLEWTEVVLLLALIHRERGYMLCEGHAASNGGPQR
jgi:hypothetical protein